MTLQLIKFVHLLGITIWVGSLVFFTLIAAPSIFKNLPRETAGEVIGPYLSEVLDSRLCGEYSNARQPDRSGIYAAYVPGSSHTAACL